MESSGKERLFVGTNLSPEPEIGRWLWALEDTRQLTLEALTSLTPAMIDWIPPGNESAVGTVLYHIANIEADWLYVEVLELPAIPPDVAALFPHPTRDENGHLTQVLGLSLDQHLKLLETVRGLLLAVFRSMDLPEFRRVRSLPHYDVTPEWVLHHLIQHEAEHRGQVASLQTRAQNSAIN